MMLGTADVKGKKYVDEMISLKSGAIDYYWDYKEGGKAVAQENFSVYSFYGPWKWIVAVGHKQEELTQIAKRLGTTFFC